MSRLTCQECAHSDFSADGPGLCRLHPPKAFVVVLPVRTVAGDSLSPTPVSTLPSIRPQDWCGQGERKGNLLIA